MQPALTCSPPPSAAQRSEYFNPKGRWCLRGEVLAGCSQAGAGLRAAGRPPGMGAARPPAHSPAPAEVGAPPPLLLFLVLRGTASRWAHEERSGCRCQAQLRLGADRGCGRRRKRREGRKEGGGREEGRGGGDAALGKGISPLSGRSRLPAPSEGDWRRHGDSFYLPKTRRWLLKRDPGSKQPAWPHSPPPSLLLLHLDRIYRWSILDKNEEPGQGVGREPIYLPICI